MAYTHFNKEIMTKDKDQKDSEDTFGIKLFLVAVVVLVAFYFIADAYFLYVN